MTEFINFLSQSHTIFVNYLLVSNCNYGKHIFFILLYLYKLSDLSGLIHYFTFLTFVIIYCIVKLLYYILNINLITNEVFNDQMDW